MPTAETAAIDVNGHVFDDHAVAGPRWVLDAVEPDRAQFWRSAPLDGRFSVAALVIGMAMHMTMAMLFGTLIAVAAFRMPGARSMVIAAGVLFTALLWAVMQYGIWRAIDATAAGDFTPWVFAIAHWLFGLMAASWAALAIEDADPPPPRHALPRQSAGPRNWFS